jgi:hypothetical protein
MMRIVFGRLAICVGSLAVLLTGCSGGGISGTAPVTGKVTYKGEPVEGAVVSFIGEGEGARVATAISGPGGTYELTTVANKGALPGKYSVTVTKTEIAAGAEQSMEEAAKSLAPLPASKELLPAKYSNPAQSPLKFEVKSGTNTIDLPLTD